jgi:hypothetical protein
MGWAARANRSHERHDPPTVPTPSRSRAKDMSLIRDYLHMWFGVPLKKSNRPRVRMILRSESQAALKRRAGRDRRPTLAAAHRLRRRHSEILKRPKNGVVTRWTMTTEDAAAWDKFYGRKREAAA